MSDSDELDAIERKIEAMKSSARPPDYSARMSALYLAREKAQERQFKRSLTRRAKGKR